MTEDSALNREWEALHREYAEAAAANEDKWGVAVAWVGESLQEMKDRESDRANRLIRAVLEDHAYQHTMAVAEFHTLVAYMGRVYGPRALYHLDFHEALQPEAYPKIVGYVWGLAEFPGMALDRRDWVRLFRKAGYIGDSEHPSPPTQPVTLWRGSWPKYRRGLAWTDNRVRAEWFVKARSGNPRLWTVTVPPDRVLARLHEEGRGEEEWIVDVRGLEVKEVKSSE